MDFFVNFTLEDLMKQLSLGIDSLTNILLVRVKS